MKVFEDYIIFRVWTDWVLLNIYFKQKQRFPFMKEFGQYQKHTKKCRFQLGNFKYNKNKTQTLKQKSLTQ